MKRKHPLQRTRISKSRCLDQKTANLRTSNGSWPCSRSQRVIGWWQRSWCSCPYLVCLWQYFSNLSSSSTYAIHVTMGIHVLTRAPISAAGSRGGRLRPPCSSSPQAELCLGRFATKLPTMKALLPCSSGSSVRLGAFVASCCCSWASSRAPFLTCCSWLLPELLSLPPGADDGILWRPGATVGLAPHRSWGPRGRERNWDWGAKRCVRAFLSGHVGPAGCWKNTGTLLRTVFRPR